MWGCDERNGNVKIKIIAWVCPYSILAISEVVDNLNNLLDMSSQYIIKCMCGVVSTATERLMYEKKK